MKFSPGDLVRNLQTNEDGKIIEAYKDRDGSAMYMVSVPNDSAGWSLGGKVGYWPEHYLDASTI
jgi:hypothetical protein